MLYKRLGRSYHAAARIVMLWIALDNYEHRFLAKLL